MKVDRFHVWPYQSLETNRLNHHSKKISLPQLETFTQITGSSLKEVMNALRTIRNAYELGLANFGEATNDSPEIAFMRSFLYCNGKKLNRLAVRKLIKQHGGIEYFATATVQTLSD